MAKQIAAPIVQDHLGDLNLVQALKAHVAAQGLERADCNRRARRNFYAADLVGTLQRGRLASTTGQQKDGEQQPTERSMS
jgi:hypothetical protein